MTQLRWPQRAAHLAMGEANSVACEERSLFPQNSVGSFVTVCRRYMGRQARSSACVDRAGSRIEHERAQGQRIPQEGVAQDCATSAQGSETS